VPLRVRPFTPQTSISETSETAETAETAEAAEYPLPDEPFFSLFLSILFFFAFGLLEKTSLK